LNTEYIKIDFETEEGMEGLRRAAACIRGGGLVVFPTETVYGLGADGTNADAATKIYEAKGRPSDNPLIIHIADPEDASLYAETGALYKTLAEAFMPGPLTVVMPARDSVPMKTRGGLSTVAVRCPAHPVANLLIRLSGVCIAAPSANLSGKPSPTDARQVADDMMGRVDMILDDGSADFGLESTIVKIEDDNTLTLLRPGRITPEELSAATGVHLSISDAVTDKLKEGALAPSPGMKYRHYAPTAPVTLLDGDSASCIEYIRKNGSFPVGIIAYDEDVEGFKEAFPDAKIYAFGKREDELTQAHELFKILRLADKDELSEIFAPLPRKSGIGLALYNRMIRAASHRIVHL
jgi:L-threonylcarbamoyladenylate synthase